MYHTQYTKPTLRLKNAIRNSAFALSVVAAMSTFSCKSPLNDNVISASVRPVAIADPKHPLCGNNKRDSEETCDGKDAKACSNECKSDCTCPSTGKLEVHYIDVGQGDAILVVSPTMRTMLIDAGKFRSDGSKISDYLALHTAGFVNYFVASHFHADHIGGLSNILKDGRTTVDNVVDRGCSVSGNTFMYYADFTAQFSRRNSRCACNDVSECVPVASSEGVDLTPTIDLGREVQIRLLHVEYEKPNENNNSLVITLLHGDRTFLFGGDCEGDSSKSCETTFNPGKIDVYKVHHHGSDTSTSIAFLAHMAPGPQISVISVGARNHYGHPSPDVIARLTAAGSKVYRTDELGDIVLQSDGQSVRLIPKDDSIDGPKAIVSSQ